MGFFGEGNKQCQVENAWLVRDFHVTRKVKTKKLFPKNINSGHFSSTMNDDLTGVFKVTNLVVAGLCVVGGLSQLFYSFHAFVCGLYIIVFGGVIGALEFTVPAEAYAYASFLFSFIGRGVFYTFLGVSLSGGSFFRVFAGLVVFGIGLAYVVLETVPSISPPDNMNPDGAVVGLDDEV